MNCGHASVYTSLMQSTAATVAEYLAELPLDRRQALSVVRKVILDNLDEDYEEGMYYGGIGYCVPHRVFPAGYHCDPTQTLCFAGLSSQKHYMSLYLMSVYMETEHKRWFEAAWKKSGKKLDMGKCCIRFKKLEDLPLEVIGEAIRRVPAKKWIAIYERARAMTAQRSEKGKPPAKSKTTTKQTRAARPQRRTARAAD